jgi:hypothetical protein
MNGLFLQSSSCVSKGSCSGHGSAHLQVKPARRVRYRNLSTVDGSVSLVPSALAVMGFLSMAQIPPGSSYDPSSFPELSPCAS